MCNGSRVPCGKTERARGGVYEGVPEIVLRSSAGWLKIERLQRVAFR